jgi:RimJ/RimL family protein N-acetyltransferase
LRKFLLEDVEALFQCLGDSESMQFYSRPKTWEETMGWIKWCQKSYAAHGHGLWAVIFRENASCIGDCGLSIQMVDGVPEPEIGYHIRKDYWKQGLATEAALACRDYAFDTLNMPRIISCMHPDNVPSRRVAEKVGMRLEKSTQGRQNNPVVVYSMIKEMRDDLPHKKTSDSH